MVQVVEILLTEGKDQALFTHDNLELHGTQHLAYWCLSPRGPSY